jgi:dihydropteroate synthase
MVSPVTTFNCRGKLLVFDNPIVMGILNTNHDSFYENSRVNDLAKAIDRVGEMIENGAKIIDIGGVSTRPGAQMVSESEELDRLLPYIVEIKSKYKDVFLSVDTFRAIVAKEAFQAGIHIINDISGGQFDEKMFKVLAELKLPYVLMHNNESFENMHLKAGLTDPVTSVFDYFTKKIKLLNENGVYDIFLDPGFGFGKTMTENYSLLKNIEFFSILNLPILIGISRKSMIYKKLNISIEESLNATSTLHMFALMQGAKVLRVHDVKEAVQTVELYNYLQVVDNEYESPD